MKAKPLLFNLGGCLSWVELGGTDAALGHLTSLVAVKCVQHVKEVAFVTIDFDKLKKKS